MANVTFLFTFGAFSRYAAYRVETRFGIAEYHVCDAEISDPACPDMPTIIRQFDSLSELESFVAEKDGVTSEDLGGVVVDKIGRDWRLDMIDFSKGIADVHDQIHAGAEGYKEIPISDIHTTSIKDIR